jgi:hypothetical protein
METSMTAYQTGQEYKTLRWGMMPTPVKVGESFAEVRARGTFSAAIQDPGKVSAIVENPDDLPRYLQNLLALAANDFLGERSAACASLAQLTTLTPDAARALEAQASGRLAAAGLRLTALSIEAIEGV